MIAFLTLLTLCLPHYILPPRKSRGLQGFAEVCNQGKVSSRGDSAIDLLSGELWGGLWSLGHFFFERLTIPFSNTMLPTGSWSKMLAAFGCHWTGFLGWSSRNPHGYPKKIMTPIFNNTQYHKVLSHDSIIYYVLITCSPKHINTIKKSHSTSIKCSISGWFYIHGETQHCSMHCFYLQYFSIIFMVKIDDEYHLWLSNSHSYKHPPVVNSNQRTCVDQVPLIWKIFSYGGFHSHGGVARTIIHWQ